MRLLSSAIDAGNFAGRLLVASCWTAMLIAGAAAETPPPPGRDAAIAAPAIAGSAPQTGSSAHTSGEAFAAKIVVVIDKPTQEMKVFVDAAERYAWKVSTGTQKYDTPTGAYTARSMNEMWYSKQWDDAPMPHAIFFTRGGHAIHGTAETQKLGRPASHGCVRLAPENARTLFALVKETGLKNTEIVLNGDLPQEEPKVASPAPPKQETKPAKKTAKIVPNKTKPSGKKSLARSEPKKPPVAPKKQTEAKQKPVATPKPAPKTETAAKSKPTAKSKTAAKQPAAAKPKAASKTKTAAKSPSKPAPKKSAGAKYDPYAVGPRRLSRQELLQLYYYGGTSRLPRSYYYYDPRLLPR